MLNNRDKDISRFTANDFIPLDEEIEGEWLELLANHLVKLCPSLGIANAEPDIGQYYDYI